MKKWLWVIGIIALVIFIGLAVLGYWLQWGWTGLPDHIGPRVPSDHPYQPAKTLWDWLNLLGVLAIPAAVGLGTIWFTRKQAQESEKENRDNQRENALQAYIDKMSELLLENNLCRSAEGNEVREVARVRTLTILKRLDPERKASVLQFLYESGLINKDGHVIDLRGADLSRASLSGANLSGANLGGANLSDALLWRTNLSGVDLSGADLGGANLSGADLSRACLNRAHMSRFSADDVILRRPRLLRPRVIDVRPRGATLRGATLRGATLHDADLQAVHLVCADLSGADLSGAILADANLTDAIGVTNEQLSKAKTLRGATLHNRQKYLWDGQFTDVSSPDSVPGSR